MPNKYKVEMQIQQATSPEQTRWILSLCGGKFKDKAGKEYGVQDVCDLIASLLDTPAHKDFRKLMGYNITTKPHKEPKWTDIYRMVRMYNCSQGVMFWRRLGEITKVRVRQLK